MTVLPHEQPRYDTRNLTTKPGVPEALEETISTEAIDERQRACVSNPKEKHQQMHVSNLKEADMLGEHHAETGSELLWYAEAKTPEGAGTRDPERKVSITAEPQMGLSTRISCTGEGDVRLMESPPDPVRHI